MDAAQATTNGGEDYTQFESDDSYVVLGIGEDASDAEIKVRFSVQFLWSSAERALPLMLTIQTLPIGSLP